MNVFKYIRDTKSEMKHVSWPTRKQVVAYTILVIIISALISVYLGLVDAGFTEIIKFTF